MKTLIKGILFASVFCILAHAQSAQTDPCMVKTRVSVNINLTASATLVTGTAAQRIYVCWLQFGLSATAENVALVEGTGTLCATGIAGMAGGTTAATGWNLTANGSVTGGGINLWGYKTVTTGDNVCLLVDGVAQVSGTLVYVKL